MHPLTCPLLHAFPSLPPGSFPGAPRVGAKAPRTETRFVPAALQLVRALDLPAGSCAFEENTCGFDSVLAFRPWILNEEGKETRCSGARGELPCWLALSRGKCYLGVKSPWKEKCASWILLPNLSSAAWMAKEEMGEERGVLCLPGLG